MFTMRVASLPTTSSMACPSVAIAKSPPSGIVSVGVWRNSATRAFCGTQLQCRWSSMAFFHQSAKGKAIQGVKCRSSEESNNVSQSVSSLSSSSSPSLSVSSTSEEESSSSSGESSLDEKPSSAQGIQIDLGLPRRSQQVEFTCNVCQTRSQRLINPEAYRNGTVFVQCAGCEAYHQLVDNLNLIEEYNFRKETASEDVAESVSD